MTSVILVLATDEAGIPEATGRLRDLGAEVVETVSPSESRRLLLASVPDDPEAGRIVTCLQSEGYAAVLRPSGGAPLEAWVRHASPVAIGRRLTVCFTWSEPDRRAWPNVVELDPGGGFGTGRHPSTRLLLEAIEGRIRGGERVLDVGCGSGVLGLGALRLGASAVVAVDTDGRAVESVRRNAVLNGMRERVDARPVPLAAIDGFFDVVVANIGWSALVELAPELVGHLATFGWLGVSGFAAAHCARVAAALRPLDVTANPSDGEWSALVLGRTVTGPPQSHRGNQRHPSHRPGPPGPPPRRGVPPEP